MEGSRRPFNSGFLGPPESVHQTIGSAIIAGHIHVINTQRAVKIHRPRYVQRQYQQTTSMQCMQCGSTHATLLLLGLKAGFTPLPGGR